MTRTSQLLSRLATKIKGEPYEIDPQIGPGYLGGLAVGRALMIARGAVSFPTRRQRPFMGRGAQVRSRAQFTFGSGCTLGIDAFIDALSRDGVRWGDGVSLGRNSRIECTGNLRTLGKGMVVGDNVGLGTDCFYGCAGGIEIGTDTIIGNFVTMHSENHVIDALDQPIRQQGVTHAGIRIGSNCWLGAKVTVLDGVTLGDGCVVAAGAVLVAGDYPAHGIYGGTPARLLKQRPGAADSAAQGSDAPVPADELHQQQQDVVDHERGVADTPHGRETE